MGAPNTGFYFCRKDYTPYNENPSTKGKTMPYFILAALLFLGAIASTLKGAGKL